MFGLFKRSKLETWESNLLKSILGKLPAEYSYLNMQFDDGLIRKVRIDASDIPGYIAFGFNYDVYKKYYNKFEPAFKLKNIAVYESNSNKYFNFILYVSGAILIGYSIVENKKGQFDPSKIDLSNLVKEMIFSTDFINIENLLTDNEKLAINPSLVFKVNIFGKDIFNILQLEDGDFIGIDLENKIYKVTHDPYEITPMVRQDLFKILKECNT